MCNRGALLHFGAPVLRFAVSITRSFSLLPKFIALVQTMKATCSGRSVHQALSFAGSQAFFHDENNCVSWQVGRCGELC